MQVGTAAKPPATTVIYGFPKRFTTADVRAFLEDYRLSTWGIARESFVPLMSSVYLIGISNSLANTLAGSSGKQSRWAVHLDSLSDAHRLVRHLHMKRFILEDGVETTLGARVLYTQDESTGPQERRL